MLWDLIQLLPAVDAAYSNLTTHQQTEQEQFRGMDIGQATLRFHPPSKLSVEPLDCVGRAKRLPSALRKAIEREQLFSGFVKAVGHLHRPLLPLGDKRIVRLTSPLERVVTDNPMIVGPHFLQGMTGPMVLQIPQLVDRAALRGDAPILLDRAYFPRKLQPFDIFM